MIIEDQFEVGAEIDTVWRQLLDMEGVASCLPGATIKATDRQNVYGGSMRLKIGPLRVEYRGTATLSDVDEESHTATISLSAREAKGQGSAMATIRNQLEPTATGTHVRARTELQITGPQAQFGRGVIEDVGKRVLGEFAQQLEQRIARSSGSAGATPSAESGSAHEAGPANDVAAAAGPRAAVASELDVGALVSGTTKVRVGGSIAALLVIVLVLRRRHR